MDELWASVADVAPVRKARPMSALGHSRPSHFVPVLNNVRYASDSDHSRYESILTLWAISGHSRLPFPKNMQPLRTGNEPGLNPFSRSSLARRKQQLPLLGADALRERGCPKLGDQRGLRKASRQCTRQRLERPEQEILGHEFPAR
jgi:hypothetical protein